MKRSLLFLCSLFVCSAALAYDVDPKVDRAVRDAIPVCGDSKISYDAFEIRLPARFKSTLVKVESKRPSCEGQYVAVTSPTGGVFVGVVWPIEQEDGKTIEEKLKNFTWTQMHMNVTPVVDRTKPTDDGLYKVTLLQATEPGKVPLEGEVDPQGKAYFFGHFRRLTADVRATRTKAFEPFVAHAPTKGPATAPVTIVEFSDFECPSCRRASTYLDPIFAKHPEKIRYVRFDLPLHVHPWAFSAAVAGRAIYRQKPEMFWEYKKQVYANQDTINAFMFADWARAFAQDHDLDLKQYDADVNSAEIRDELLKGAGAAFSTDVRATPTYIVNGVFVDAGDSGQALVDYVEKLLAK